jgi:hypothetical protein
MNSVLLEIKMSVKDLQNYVRNYHMVIELIFSMLRHWCKRYYKYIDFFFLVDNINKYYDYIIYLIILYLCTSIAYHMTIFI